MPLRVRELGNGRRRFMFSMCPICRHIFDKYEHRWKHFLDEHEPEDLGLSPLGEIPEDHDEPLFTPPSEIPGINEENAAPLKTDEEVTFGLEVDEVEVGETGSSHLQGGQR